jgi:hypothetical protein
MDTKPIVDTLADDKAVVRSVWKSARAVEDWPGKVTIRRFSPYKTLKVEGEGTTIAEAWKNTANKIRKIWKDDEQRNKGAHGPTATGE